jgi:hypothetical protein
MHLLAAGTGIRKTPSTPPFEKSTNTRVGLSLILLYAAVLGTPNRAPIPGLCGTQSFLEWSNQQLLRPRPLKALFNGSMHIEPTFSDALSRAL